ncbi:MAG: alpha/beta fold hydrolase, partial [Phycicoccus sp.]
MARLSSDAPTARTEVARAVPVAFLNGGPGDATLAGDAIRLASSPVLAGRDIVLWDQRGTGASRPRLGCREMEDAIRSVDESAAAETSEATTLTAASRACAKRLVAAGHDLSAFTTVQNAADVDDVRRALGIARWDLWGVSYGTLLAQETMRRYPDGIRRVVLDSVSPAVQPGPEGAFSSDGELTRLLTGCQLDRACRSMLPDPQAALTRVVNRYQERPRPIVIDGDAEAGVPSRRVLLTGNDVAGLFARAVGVTELQASLPHRLARLDAGDPRGLDELAQQLITPAASTDATSEFPIDVGTYLAVTCHDSSGGAGAAADREAALDIIARTPRLTRTS